MLSVNKYLRWLRGLVHRPGPSYDILFDMAWVTHYEYPVPNDDNRAQDGLKLRERFEYETSIRLPHLGECTMLEFLIALAIRLNESVYDHTYPNQETYWFWILMGALKLDEYDDSYDFTRIHDEIQNIFMRLNRREYDSDGGNGGLFPLDDPIQDQRGVEVWYQMMAYLQENV
ncbi:MAG: hypothetical protein KAV87_26975 [Desulfobacteraceae bacterium]|nr:hypothetical protein [Desulfobacteraceae bacterium]